MFIEYSACFQILESQNLADSNKPQQLLFLNHSSILGKYSLTTLESLCFTLRTRNKPIFSWTSDAIVVGSAELGNNPECIHSFWLRMWAQ